MMQAPAAILLQGALSHAAAVSSDLPIAPPRGVLAQCECPYTVWTQVLFQGNLGECAV